MSSGSEETSFATRKPDAADQMKPRSAQYGRHAGRWSREHDPGTNQVDPIRLPARVLARLRRADGLGSAYGGTSLEGESLDGRRHCQLGVRSSTLSRSPWGAVRLGPGYDDGLVWIAPHEGPARGALPDDRGRPRLSSLASRGGVVGRPCEGRPWRGCPASAAVAAGVPLGNPRADRSRPGASGQLRSDMPARADGRKPLADRLASCAPLFYGAQLAGRDHASDSFSREVVPDPCRWPAHELALREAASRQGRFGRSPVCDSSTQGAGRRPRSARPMHGPTPRRPPDRSDRHVGVGLHAVSLRS